VKPPGGGLAQPAGASGHECGLSLNVHLDPPNSF
jgi:hypothetical protein